MGPRGKRVAPTRPRMLGGRMWPMVHFVIACSLLSTYYAQALSWHWGWGRVHSSK